MRLSKARIVAAKDLKTFRRKRSILYSIVLFPLIVSIGLPLVVFQIVGSRSGGIPPSLLGQLMDSFSFFFIIGAATLPTSIASYSILGEKVEKSLEPLLATPTTDGEILLGKSLASLIPPISAIYAGSVVFMALMDRAAYSKLGYLYFPNWTIGMILLLLTPLAAILSVELNVILSSRVNDIRTAQQLGAIVVLPFAGIYVASETGQIVLSTTNLLYMAGILVVIDLALFYGATATFKREEILTKWK